MFTYICLGCATLCLAAAFLYMLLTYNIPVWAFAIFSACAFASVSGFGFEWNEPKNIGLILCSAFGIFGMIVWVGAVLGGIYDGNIKKKEDD